MASDPEAASNLVLAAVVIVAGSTMVRKVAGGEWKNGEIAQITIFGFLLAAALLIIAIVSPEIASILSYLALVGAFVVNGPSIFKLLGDLGRVNNSAVSPR